VFERLRVEGPNYLQKNAALAEEIRRTFVDIDEIEKELKKAERRSTMRRALPASTATDSRAYATTPAARRCRTSLLSCR